MSSPRDEEKEMENRARQDFNAALNRVLESLRKTNQSLSEFSSQVGSDSSRTAKTSELSQVLSKEINILEREPNPDLKIAAAQRAITAVETCKTAIYGDETLKKSGGPIAWLKKKAKEHANAYVSVKDIFMNFNDQDLPARLQALTEASGRVKRFATAVASVSEDAAQKAPPLLSTLYAKPATKTEATEKTSNPSEVIERNDRPKIE